MITNYYDIMALILPVLIYGYVLWWLMLNSIGIRIFIYFHNFRNKTLNTRLASIIHA
jgi:hypothetical protein